MSALPKDTQVRASEHHKMAGQIGRTQIVFEAILAPTGSSYIVLFEGGQRFLMQTDDFEVVK